MRPFHGLGYIPYIGFMRPFHGLGYIPYIGILFMYWDIQKAQKEHNLAVPAAPFKRLVLSVLKDLKCEEATCSHKKAPGLVERIAPASRRFSSLASGSRGRFGCRVARHVQAAEALGQGDGPA